jgi:aspartate aminotransferase-like enzyme
MGARARDRAKTMGLGVLFPELHRWSPTLTALRTPTDVSPRTLKKGLEQRGILIAGGLEPYNNNAIRIGHMGDIRVSDVERTCDALEAVLAEAR